MTPLDLEERIRQVEQKQATLMAQMDEVRHQITVLGALPVQFAELANSVLNLKDDIQEISSTLRRRDEDATDERKSVRIALLGLTGVIIAALIAAAATIIAAHGG
jgi:predicted  nucleic acid-binding Zn-ribbon protein